MEEKKKENDFIQALRELRKAFNKVHSVVEYTGIVTNISLNDVHEEIIYLRGYADCMEKFNIPIEEDKKSD